MSHLLFTAASPLFAPDTSTSSMYSMGVAGLIVGGACTILAIGMAVSKDKLFAFICSVIAAIFLAIGFGSMAHNGGFEPPITSEEHAEQVAEWLDDEYEIDVTGSSTEALLDGEALSVEYNDTDVLIELHRSGDDGITVYSVDTKSTVLPIDEVK